MRKETITTVENIGAETHTMNLNFILHRDDIELIDAVKKAVAAYINSGYGFQEYERNCYCFNWGDVSSIPNSFFLKFGIEKAEDGTASIPVDYNEQLFSSLNLSFSDEQWKQLKKELFMEGKETLEEFLDMDIDENMEKDSIENLLDQVANEMTAGEKLRAFSQLCLKEQEEDLSTSAEKTYHIDYSAEELSCISVITKEEYARDIVKDIEWDTDGDEEVFDSLPQEIILPKKFSKENSKNEKGIFGKEEKAERLEDISDWLSEEYEFCHKGFVLIDADNSGTTHTNSN